MLKLIGLQCIFISILGCAGLHTVDIAGVSKKDKNTRGRVDIKPVQRWSFDSSSPVYGSPAMDHTRIYLGNIEGEVYALDKESGGALWQFDAASPIYSAIHPSANALYFQTDNGFVYKLAKSGKLLWRQASAPIENRARFFGPNGWDYKSSTPIEFANSVYVGDAAGGVQALRADNGKVLWHFQAEGKIQSDILVTQDQLFFGTWEGYVYALSRKDGSLQWQHDTREDFDTAPFLFIINTEAAHKDDTLFIGGRHTQLLALNKHTGEVTWKHPYVSSWVESPILTYDNSVYTGSSFLKSQLAFNAHTGEPLWQAQEINGVSFGKLAATENTIYASTAAVPGLIFDGFLSEGGLLKLDRHSGAKKWFFPLEKGPYINEFGSVSEPLVEGNTVYLGALDGKLYAIEEVRKEYPILEFSASRTELKKGEVLQLNWQVLKDHQTQLNGQTVKPVASFSERVCESTSYHLKAEGRLKQQAKIKVQITSPAEINIAAYGQASASSNENDSKLHAGFAIDNDPTTRWSSAFQEGESIQLDLGKTYSLDRILLQWEGSYARHYIIEASNDGVNWSTFYENKQNTGGINTIENLKVQARYLRLVGLKRAQPYGISLFEFAVFEKPDPQALAELAAHCP